jgi:HD-GYP domain-containing protein (c-di-GMP phosphodiesterase class II)
VVRHHHERFDGRGYPDKLRGPWIPLEARILSVAQAYAAMILDQPRRPGMTPAQAREKLWTPEKEKAGAGMKIWTPGSP